MEKQLRKTVLARASGLAVSVVAAVALVVAPALAQDPPLPRPRPTVGRLPIDETTALNAINVYFNAVQTLRGEFIQIGPTADQLSEGVFYMARPGRIRFEYYPPSQLLIVSNGSTVLIQNRATRTNDRYPLQRTPLAPLVASHLDLTAEENVRDVLVEETMIGVVLAESDEGWLTLYFDRQTLELKQWVTVDAQGNTITFAIYNLAVNQPLDDALFELPERV